MADDPPGHGLMGPNPRPTPRPGFAALRPHLLVGEYPTAADARWLAETHGVTAVVSLQDDADLAAKGLYLVELEDAYREAGLAFARFPVPDGDEGHLVARLAAVVAHVAGVVDGGGRVYLHCNAGYNRAPTVAIAFLTAHEGLSVDAARAAMRACRSCAPYTRAVEAFARYGKPARR
jgi:protein-tyrosine phosphatase